MNLTEKLYRVAAEIYAERGVNVDVVMKRLDQIPLSINAWQGDDVTGFESTGHALTGGCQVTGNYPGRAAMPMNSGRTWTRRWRYFPARPSASACRATRWTA